MQLDKEIIKRIKIILTPWKKNSYNDDSEINNAYNKGWNDCLKQMSKNYNKYLKPWINEYDLTN